MKEDPRTGPVSAELVLLSANVVASQATSITTAFHEPLCLPSSPRRDKEHTVATATTKQTILILVFVFMVYLFLSFEAQIRASLNCGFVYSLRALAAKFQNHLDSS
jgi:hypothetical protein